MGHKQELINFVSRDKIFSTELTDKKEIAFLTSSHQIDLLTYV